MLSTLSPIFPGPQQFLGYKPKVHFEEGLSRTVDWYRSNDLRLQTAEPAARDSRF